MKVIDLLNKRKNNEKMPKKIRFRNMEFYLANDYEAYNINYIYENENEEYWLDFLGMNTEIEIIEEDKEIKKGIKPFEEYLEEVKFVGCDEDEAKKVYLDRLSKIVIELTESVNELKKEGK